MARDGLSRKVKDVLRGLQALRESHSHGGQLVSGGKGCSNTGAGAICKANCRGSF